MSRTHAYMREARKRKGIMEFMTCRGRKRGLASKPGVKQMGGPKETKTATLAKRSLSSKGTGQVLLEEMGRRDPPKDTTMW